MHKDSTPALMDPATTSRDIRAYARVLLQYAPLIIGITFVTTLIAVLYSFVTPPVYQAYVTVRINRETSSAFPTVGSQFDNKQGDLDYFQTQIRLFRSPSLVRAVLKQLEVAGKPYAPEGAVSSEQKVAQFLKKIDVRPEPRTQLVKVILEDADKYKAKEYADLVAETYIREYIRANVETARRYRDFYEKAVTEREQVIVERERDVLDFRRANKVDEKELEQLQVRNQALVLDLQTLRDEHVSTNAMDETRRFEMQERLREMTNELSTLRVQIQKMENIKAETDMLKSRAAMARNTHEWLLKLSEQSYVFSQEFDPRNISIVDPAAVPEQPARPKRAINTLLGMVFGVIIGVCVAFFAEYLDDTIKSPTDIETYLKTPFLGLIPALTKSISATPVELVVESEPKGNIAESYRAIRTNIIFSSDRQIKRIVVTSSGPGEGKTTTAVNIANVMARAGDKTLLIDADMRRPRVHKIFNIESTTRGLSNYLVGNTPLDELFQATRVEGLSVLTAGPIPPNPVELLNSPRLKELFEVAGRQFDRIIVDTPPVIAVTDSAILSRLADAVIIAIHGGRTHRDVCKRAIDVVQNVGGHILGVILNNVNIYRASYYDYYYYSYYRYAYGYKYGYSTHKKGEPGRKKKAATNKDL
ncbi:MAG: polysaccharide biosynthesis tyrosine autokinase [bacterium]|nr:polysaccharide biosynthesis tyrosine autokinase [bacterium]